MTAQILDRDNPDAPFGYDEDGTVVAPFGLKANGQPRLSNRGRSAGQGFGTPKRTTAPAPPKRAKRTAAETPAARRGGVDYATVATGLVQLSTIGITAIGADPGGLVSRLIGKKQVTAIKGDAVILGMYAETLGSAIGGLATINPWLANKLEGGNIQKEVVVFATTVAQLGASLIANHRAPNEELAAMGDQASALQAQEIRRNLQQMTEQQAPAGPTDEQLADELAMREHLQHLAEQQQAPAFVSDFAVQHPGQVPGQTDVYEQLAHAS